MPSVLVFDGDCAFCRQWVGYWQATTGNTVEYVPYQTAAKRFPEVPVDDFKKAVQLFDNGQRYSGAAAALHLMHRTWLYNLMPALFNWLYSLIAANRNLGYKVTKALWGAQPLPSKYNRASSLFARGIALIYLIAFISFGRQIRGLIGENGVQPLFEYLTEVTRTYGSAGHWIAPGLFWWTHSEFALESIAWGGAVLSFVAMIGRPHTGGQKAAYAVLFIYYLSIVSGGQIFTGFQWDYLLLEAGFLAIFLKPSARGRIFLFQWLLFRVMFQSGAVKLLSHDVTWRNLTALSFHYWTQPLPTALAWYAAQLPMWFQQLSTAFMFLVELVLPFLIFGPRRLKQIAGVGIITLQTLILLTGNYNFFNLLTIALCLFLFDDAFFPAVKALKSPKLNRRGRPVKVPVASGYVTAVLVVFIMILSLAQLGRMFGISAPTPVEYVASHASNFGIVNGYGLFAVMTTERHEISIEGSDDNIEWRPYVFKYKPGPLNRAPGWVAPDQPRLDWQMWFAALGTWRENPWLLRLMTRLLQGSEPVLQLIEHNPFPSHPPKYMRAELYDYSFTNYDERRQTGNWWKRTAKGEYFPPISLKGTEAPSQATTQ